MLEAVLCSFIYRISSAPCCLRLLEPSQGGLQIARVVAVEEYSCSVLFICGHSFFARVVVDKAVEVAKTEDEEMEAQD